MQGTPTCHRGAGAVLLHGEDQIPSGERFPVSWSGDILRNLCGGILFE